ncbi:radical SAM protein [uncultured Desulfovibrio sp.]|uniref:radical SAM protein n=1 Tax=uncultured Desulfovibrio sp. TaxID=167968 RepID=UPI002805D9E1|nr:radical SAM protein [uncultured Desulfovibrio sp.]
MKNSVYIPSFYEHASGGVKTFFLNFEKSAEKIKYPFLESPAFAKAIFFANSTDLKLVQAAKKWGATIIQRLDGIFYAEKHGDHTAFLNADIKEIYSNYTDFFIFQSEYSKKQCEHIFGPAPESQSQIIYNGADHSIFFPGEQPKKISKQIRFITTGNMRHTSMLLPIIKALNMLQPDYSLELVVCGPLNDECRSLIDASPFCRWAGALDAHGVADQLRSADIFLYSFCNPPCPNSVIEAISCAIPVVSYQSGAMAELCDFNAELLTQMPSKLLHEYHDFSSEALAEVIRNCIKNFDKFAAKAKDNWNRYDMQTCVKSYCEVFDSQSNRNIDAIQSIQWCMKNIWRPNNTSSINLNCSLAEETKKYISYKKKHNFFKTLQYRSISQHERSIYHVNSVMFETSSKCNLKCSFCSQQYKENCGTFMELEQAKQYIAKLPTHLKYMQMHCSGEPFLNPDFPNIVALLAKRKIFTSVSSNGTMPFSRYIAALKAGLSELIFAIDGFTPETHEKYRVGSKLGNIAETLFRILKERPDGCRVGVQYLVTRHNEHEVHDMALFLRKIGADFFNLKTISFDIAVNSRVAQSSFESHKTWLPQNQHFSRYKVCSDRLKLKWPIVSCPYVFQPVIRANGTLGLCCIDLDCQVDIGCLDNYESFESLWNQEAYREIRDKALAGKLSICRNCNFSQMPLLSYPLK